LPEEYPLTEYLTEQEQIELLKTWIKQYSLVILAGMALAFVSITGWRYWQQRQNKIISHASSVYDEMLTVRAQNNASATLVQADKLFTHYPHTVYSQMAALMLARDAINKKDFAAAEKHYEWVIDHSSVDSFRQIARIRLARVLLVNGNPQKSLDTLKTVNEKSYQGMIEEVKGDAYLAMHNIALAREAYKKALAELPNAEVIRPLLQMKYDNLATSTPQAS
jgi:predicted negative regulator of RcsB-dependent stress response